MLSKVKIFKKILAFPKYLMYTNTCCDMIAVKREVAAKGRFFRGANVKLGNWRQVTVLQTTVTTCSKDVCELPGYTRESVQSPLVVLL